MRWIEEHLFVGSGTRIKNIVKAVFAIIALLIVISLVSDIGNNGLTLRSIIIIVLSPLLVYIPCLLFYSAGEKTEAICQIRDMLQILTDSTDDIRVSGQSIKVNTNLILNRMIEAERKQREE